MARGNVGKDNVIQKMRMAFGNDFIGIHDKKVYVWADDGGERVQIAISMTCPKTNVDIGDSHNWADTKEEDSACPTPAAATVKSELTAEERKTINDLMARLNL